MDNLREHFEGVQTHVVKAIKKLGIASMGIDEQDTRQEALEQLAMALECLDLAEDEAKKSRSETETTSMIVLGFKRAIDLCAEYGVPGEKLFGPHTSEEYLQRFKAARVAVQNKPLNLREVVAAREARPKAARAIETLSRENWLPMLRDRATELVMLIGQATHEPASTMIDLDDWLGLAAGLLFPLEQVEYEVKKGMGGGDDIDASDNDAEEQRENGKKAGAA